MNETHAPAWPNGASCAVVVTVDVDSDLPFLGIDPAHRHRVKSRSVGRYGPEHGADRLRSLFDGLGIPSTWFLPGQVAREHPALVHRLVDSGAELAGHGMRHLDFDALTLDEQLDEMLRGRDALREVSGRDVAGLRTPAGEWQPGFVERMSAEGFTWSSSMPADDRPFWLGAEGGMLEIPFRYEIEDLQYLAFNLDPPFPPGQSRIASHRTVFDNWDVEFDAARRWGTMFLLRLNAELMGTPGRAQRLRALLERIGEHDVWMATCGQVRDAWDGMPPEPGHPYRLFTRLAADQAAGAPRPESR